MRLGIEPTFDVCFGLLDPLREDLLDDVPGRVAR
jgi:hypothetical protein